MIRLLATLLALAAGPALAACPPPAMQADVLKDALRYNGYALDAWGLNERGNMEELWRMEGGEWIVVETTPQQCATVISRPSDFMGRLSASLLGADSFGMGTMTEGEPA